MRIPARFIALALTVAAASTASAQQIAPIGALSGPVSRNEPGNGRPVSATTRALEIPARILIGGGASMLGAYGGAIGAAMFLPHADCGGCEDPGLANLVVGGAVGSVVLAAVTSAIPEMGNHCGYAKRLAFSVIGSAGAAFLGQAVAESQARNGGPYGYVAGAGIGAGLGAALCR